MFMLRYAKEEDRQEETTWTEQERRMEKLEPKVRSGALMDVKRLVVRKCREDERGGLSRLSLARAIVRSGEPEVTLSLKQYVRTVQVNAILVGFFLGFFLGGLFALGLMWNLHSGTENATRVGDQIPSRSQIRQLEREVFHGPEQ